MQPLDKSPVPVELDLDLLRESKAPVLDDGHFAAAARAVEDSNCRTAVANSLVVDHLNTIGRHRSIGLMDLVHAPSGVRLTSVATPVPFVMIRDVATIDAERGMVVTRRRIRLAPWATWRLTRRHGPAVEPFAVRCAPGVEDRYA